MLTMAWCFHDNDNPGTFHPSFTMVLDMGGARCDDGTKYWVLTMRCLAGWLTVNSGYSDWSVVTVSAVTSGPTGGWSTTDWSRREEKSPVRCVGTERLGVPGCESGPAGDGYRFTGYSTTSLPLLLLSLRLSVSHGGSRDQASLDTAGHRRKVSF